MPWLTPRSWVTNEDITATKLNEIRQQLEDLHRRTSPVNSYMAGGFNGGTNYSTLVDTALGANNFVAAGQVTVTIGSTGKALVNFSGNLENDTASANTYLTYSISGASTWPAQDAESIAFTSPAVNAGIRMGQTIVHSGLNVGLTTFHLNVRVSGGMGRWRDLRLAVTPLGA